MDADGSNQVQLTDDPALDAGSKWPPDGTRIAFWSERTGSSAIYANERRRHRPDGSLPDGGMDSRLAALATGQDCPARWRGWIQSEECAHFARVNGGVALYGRCVPCGPGRF